MCWTLGRPARRLCRPPSSESAKEKERERHARFFVDESSSRFRERERERKRKKGNERFVRRQRGRLREPVVGRRRRRSRREEKRGEENKRQFTASSRSRTTRKKKNEEEKEEDDGEERTMIFPNRLGLPVEAYWRGRRRRLCGGRGRILGRRRKQTTNRRWRWRRSRV